MSETSVILIVEDDADISEALASALEAHGYAVVVAANGRQALDELHKGPYLPRLILLDLMMPVMDGWEFRTAQMSDPALAGVPVVVVSAHGDVRKSAEEMGAVGWLKKPIDLEDLLKVVSVS